MKIYAIFLSLLSATHFLSALETILNTHYFATRTMINDKTSPINLHGKVLDDPLYKCSKNKQDNVTDITMAGDHHNAVTIINNVTMDYMISFLQKNEHIELANVIEASQNIRALFSKKRQEKDIFNLLVSNLSEDVYKGYFKRMIRNIKHEYSVNILLTTILICVIYFGSQYFKNARSVYNLNMFFWTSELVGTFFIVYQLYKYAELYIRYRLLNRDSVS